MEERNCPEGINCVRGPEVGASLVDPRVPVVSSFMHSFDIY